MIRGKVRAGAFYLALSVSLLIGIICSALVLSAYLTDVIVLRKNIRLRLRDNVRSGVNMLLNSSGKYQHDLIDLYGEGKDSVLLESFYWGLFDGGMVMSFSKGDTVKKAFLSGGIPEGVSDAALYLPDNNRPVTLTGNTNITGDCYISSAGFKRGYIGGKSYSRKYFNKGNILSSNHSMPSVNTNRFSDILVSQNPETVVPYQEAEESVEISFSDQGTEFYDDAPILLSGKKLKGKIIIRSKTSIEILPNNVLEEVILIAPYIKVHSGFKGSVQLFTTDSLITDANCTFYYPSVLSLQVTNASSAGKFLRIGEQNNIEGYVFMTNSPARGSSEASATLAGTSVVNGSLYIDGFLQPKGAVYGNVVARELLSRTPSSVYKGYLIDAVIDVSKRNPAFLNASALTDTKRKKVMKWLEKN